MKKIIKIVTFYDDGTFSESVPSAPYSPMPSIPSPWDPSTPYGPIKNNCPKCGLKLEGAMGYCCPQPQCPTGLGGVYCSTKDTL